MQFQLVKWEMFQGLRLILLAQVKIFDPVSSWYSFYSVQLTQANLAAVDGNNGYDHNWCLKTENNRDLVHAATVTSRYILATIFEKSNDLKILAYLDEKWRSILQIQAFSFIPEIFLVERVSLESDLVLIQTIGYLFYELFQLVRMVWNTKSKLVTVLRLNTFQIRQINPTSQQLRSLLVKNIIKEPFLLWPINKYWWSTVKYSLKYKHA